MCYSAAGKFCVAILIILLLVIGFIFLLGGVFPMRDHVSTNYWELSKKTLGNVQTFSWITGLLALIVCVLSVGGICLMLLWTESKCLFYWLAFMVIMAIIFDIVLIVEVEKVKGALANFLSEHLPQYGKVADSTEIVDFFQREFHCCGSNGPQDYIALNQSIPKSCCESPKTKDDSDEKDDDDDKFPFGEISYEDIKRDKRDANTINESKRKRSVPETYPTFEEKGHGDGSFDLNLPTRIKFNLPKKNISEPWPWDGEYPSPDNGGRRCQGCATHFLDEYRTYFILFYILIVAKILLQIAVGVSPCWVLIKNKFEQLGERPSDEDETCMDTK